MRNSIRYIAILLTGLFAITLLPFNAIHHHEEEQHAAALLSHEEDHSCELDERFCQETFTGKCEHGSHIGTTHVKCFSCQFHFIKTFVSAAVQEASPVVSTSYVYFAPSAKVAATDVQRIHNKGPPHQADPA